MIIKTILVLAVATAFILGIMVSAGVIFADEKPTQLVKGMYKS